MEHTHPAIMLHQISQHIDKLEDQKSSLRDTLTAVIARVEIANIEGDSILSAWLIDAKKLLKETS